MTQKRFSTASIPSTPTTPKQRKRKTPDKRLLASKRHDTAKQLLTKYKQTLEQGKEDLFFLCVKLYEQMETREDIAKLVLEVCDVTQVEAHIIATRLHRMSHDEYALDCLMHKGQEIARRYTLRKSML